MAVETGEADEADLTSVALPRQLTDVELAPGTHGRGSGIPDVRVVLPDDDLAGAHLPVEVLDQRVERSRHVLIAKIPRRHLGPVHLVVVLLGVPDEEYYHQMYRAEVSSW